MATFGKLPTVALDWLPAWPADRPRMKIEPWPGPLPPQVTLGVYFKRSFRVERFSCWMVLLDSACTVIGTFCTDSERRWAVTTTSWTPVSAAVGAAAAAAASAAKAAPALPLRTAAAAQETKNLAFMSLSP